MLNIRYRESTNTWPGFVDLFSNLVIILIFLLIMFVFLWTTTSVFNKQSGAKTVAELRAETADQAQTIEQMRADEQEARRLLIMARNELETLDNDRAELINELNETDLSLADLATAYEEKIAALTQQLNQANVDKEQIAQLEQERAKLHDEMSAQRAELADQITKLQAALDAAEEKARTQEVQYVEMSNRLNKALADKVAELNQMSQYQSAFYRAIKDALGDRTTVRADGDRFIVSSDILFASGSYNLSPDGKRQLQLIANVIKDFENKIPSDVDWIIRVDGHTDKKPVVPGTRAYRNNMQLSFLRATAVANELAKNGVSQRRLLPTGFGDLHPVELGNSAADLQKNRRIELQLTNR
ncbi:MAG: OmpA family protein [Alphaproteobacteria bacterium]|nr:OmpA family protein [Alphaproteobacteria bacterium]